MRGLVRSAAPDREASPTTFVCFAFQQEQRRGIGLPALADGGCVKTRALAAGAECFSQPSFRTEGARLSWIQKCNLEELCSPHFARARLFTQRDARGAMDPHLGGHALFDGLGAGTADRRKAYRELFRTAPDADFADALRAATNGGWALGDARFRRQTAKALSRRVAPLPKGRPPRRKPDRWQLNLL
jgi:hypothetical protein